jgi:aspartyl-tRNA(Asn)/glutamyl-tRNA(Gln) amidotransferase subunit A
VPTDGVFPLSPSLDHAGTLTATAADSIVLLRAIAGPLPVPSVVGVPVIGVLSAQLADPSVTPEVREAVRAALGRLAAAGWQLREVKPPWLEEPQRWEEALTVIVAREAVMSHSGLDTSGYAEGTRALLALGATVTPERYASARVAQAELSAAVEETLSGLDALAGPTVGYCAPAQDPPFGTGDDSAEGRFTGPYNLTGHPAVSIPVPAPGLPVGLQLAGRHNGDLALLELATSAQRLLTT